MVEGSVQIWLGFFLILLGTFWGRMGPAFVRNRYYAPILILGLLCLVIDIYELDEQGSILRDAINDFLPWFSVGFFGYYLVLIGAPTYWKTRFPQLISGWLIISVSFYLYVKYNNHISISDVFISFTSIIGISMSLIFFMFLVRFVENRIPSEDPAPELTDSEKEFVRRIISKNIGVDEE